MAFIKCALKSDILRTNVDIDLYFPTDLSGDLGGEAKGVITLLHGFTNTSEEWMMYSSAARYAADNGLVIIAPSCGNSFYNDMAFGGAYFSFLQTEMYEKLNQIFVLPRERERNFIAGLSMGGYGALLHAMTNPSRWAAAASFSGALDVKFMLSQDTFGAMRTTFEPVLGEKLEIPNESDLFFIAEKLSALPAEKMPRFFCTCGKQDNEGLMILEQNHRFVKHMRKLGINIKYTEWDGTHEWYLWDRALTMAIGYFLDNDYANQKAYNWNCKAEEL